jgi:predicted phage tail protein
MLRKIKLYGQLAKFIGRRVLEADVATAAEAVRMLVANFPGLEQHMAEQYYRVTVGTYDLGLDEIHDPAGQQEIKIMPVVVGAGGGAGKIALGIGLIALSFAFPGAGVFGAGFGVFGPLAASTISTLTTVGNLISIVGASLILGGVSELISPVPKIAQGSDTADDPRKTYNFSGIQQTSRQGVPVPAVYGLTLVGSVVISAGTDTVQVKA